MGRLGQVVEDKQCIRLKDLTSVSHGHAEPREGEGETLCSSPSVFGMEWPKDRETRPRLGGTLSLCCGGLRSVVRAGEEVHCPSPLFLHLCRMTCNSCKTCWAVSCRLCCVSLSSAEPPTRWWPWLAPSTSLEETCEFESVCVGCHGAMAVFLSSRGSEEGGSREPRSSRPARATCT